MAGVPRAAVVAVALPRADAVAVAQGLYAGMRELAERFGVDLVGGDTNAWDGPLVISVTCSASRPRAAPSAARGQARRRDPGHRPAGRKPVRRPAPPPRAADRRGAGLHEIGADPRHDRHLRRTLVRPGPHLDRERRTRGRPRRDGDPDPSRCPRDEPHATAYPHSTMRSTTAKISSLHRRLRRRRRPAARRPPCAGQALSSRYRDRRRRTAAAQSRWPGRDRSSPWASIISAQSKIRRWT